MRARGGRERERRTHANFAARDEREPDERCSRDRLAEKRAVLAWCTTLVGRVGRAAGRRGPADLLGGGARASLAVAAALTLFHALELPSSIISTRPAPPQRIHDEDRRAGDDLADRHEDGVDDAAPDAGTGPQVEEREREADRGEEERDEDLAGSERARQYELEGGKEARSRRRERRTCSWIGTSHSSQQATNETDDVGDGRAERKAPARKAPRSMVVPA